MARTPDSHTLFIADLHLSTEQPHTIALFLAFLEGPARQADALYILGDLFEVWLGDDIVIPEYTPCITALNTLSATVPIYLSHGNRDFLLGERFSAQSGCRILAEETVIDLYGTPTLLLHGDTLCTDDIHYQKLRRQLRDPAWISAFLARPPQERITAAREMRTQSREAQKEKSDAIMDVNQYTVEEVMGRHSVCRLLHGHTHRPGHHRFTLHGKDAERLVVADWDRIGSFIRCDGQGCSLDAFAQ